MSQKNVVRHLENYELSLICYLIYVTHKLCKYPNLIYFVCEFISQLPVCS